MQRDLSGNIPAPSMPRTCFLIGHPIGHSLSPVIHSAAYESLGMDWHYAVMDVLEENIDAVLAGIDGDKVVGINVTIPHKQAVFRRVDSLTDTARAVGAVNTVYRRDGKLVGDNTDVAGFMSPLHLLADRDWSSVSALILGAGGAARAVAHALTQVMGCSQVAVSARREATARAIANVNVIDWDERQGAAERAHLIVNTTPVGMNPQANASPLPDTTAFSPRHIVYDLIYAPEETQLMALASSQGAHTIGGLPMLIGQAAAAFRIWTGHDMPLEPVRKALRDHQALRGNS